MGGPPRLLIGCWALVANQLRDLERHHPSEQPPLPHKVSGLYRPEVCTVPRRVTVHRRCIEALAMEVVEHLSRSG